MVEVASHKIWSGSMKLFPRNLRTGRTGDGRPRHCCLIPGVNTSIGKNICKFKQKVEIGLEIWWIGSFP